MTEKQVDRLTVRRYATREEMGKAAAADFKAALGTLLNEKEFARIVFAAAPSQDEFLEAVVMDADIPFERVDAFHMDEYIGLPKEHPQSYYSFMWENLFRHTNIAPENVHIPDGNAKDIPGFCAAYEQRIRDAGGIDLQVLGIGQNAHIGFNEPDVKFEATTHKVKLDEETIQANARFFADAEEVPRYAISMGIKTIMLARKVILLANGRNKAEAVCKAVCGSVSPAAPASILQLHRDVTVIVDQEAAAKLPPEVLG